MRRGRWKGPADTADDENMFQEQGHSFCMFELPISPHTHVYTVKSTNIYIYVYLYMYIYIYIIDLN